MRKIAAMTMMLMFNFANAADLSTNVNVSTQVPEPAKLVLSYTKCAPLSNYSISDISVGTFTISGRL